MANTRVTSEELRITLLPPPFELVLDSSVAPAGTVSTSNFESRSMTFWSAASVLHAANAAVTTAAATTRVKWPPISAAALAPWTLTRCSFS